MAHAAPFISIRHFSVLDGIPCVEDLECDVARGAEPIQKKIN